MKTNCRDEPLPHDILDTRIATFDCSNRNSNNKYSKSFKVNFPGWVKLCWVKCFLN